MALWGHVIRSSGTRGTRIACAREAGEDGEDLARMQDWPEVTRRARHGGHEPAETMTRRVRTQQGVPDLLTVSAAGCDRVP